ncbi:SigE family RNA polymerase sigma factor [Actinomadura xylanilytica]|uniref:SigE family RNA polymerase sigma factor n=1 Tax=Actinomadura xylanilytica TaxID=887459 RepID=UPI00255A7A2E|nr:SigE family RNA polymerase sigma factor [Actinomadura xylanilytica]MDL4771930.1 SigE family RNA polymerase sigma factor [Actinomadura xylanilytica]
MAKDPDGFQEFATTRGASLFRTARLLCNDWHLAEDLVQTTLGKLYASWRRAQRADNTEAYARKVLMRTYLSHMRKRSNRETPRDQMPDTAATGGDQELRMTLLDVLARLSAQDRAVLVLRYWEDQSVEEVASLLRLSSGAVRNRSMRALDRLRAEFGEELKTLHR